MAEAPIDASAAPWGPRDGTAEAAPAATGLTRPPSPLARFAWGLLSTLLLAGWVALWAGPLGAVALILGVFVHEYGHVLVINWAGCGPSRIRIIPFFGGAATMTRLPDSDFKGVLIALAGPLFGLLAALPFFLAAMLTGRGAWLAGAFYVGALNLINLAPAAPLDGAKAAGPVLARIHPWLETAVLLIIAALVLYWAVFSGSWLFAAVLALGAARAFAANRQRVVARPLSVGEWAAGLALYLGVVALCAFVSFAAARGAGIHMSLPALPSFGVRT